MNTETPSTEPTPSPEARRRELIRAEAEAVARLYYLAAHCAPRWATAKVSRQIRDIRRELKQIPKEPTR